jgi:hypothetical protein
MSVRLATIAMRRDKTALYKPKTSAKTASRFFCITEGMHAKCSSEHISCAIALKLGFIDERKRGKHEKNLNDTAGYDAASSPAQSFQTTLAAAVA